MTINSATNVTNFSQTPTVNGVAIGTGGGGGGYPTVNTPLPTTEVMDGNIIYFTGDNDNAEGIYRWNGTAYLPGPRVLDIRSTAADGMPTTTAEDVDSITLSNEFVIDTEANISLGNITPSSVRIGGDLGTHVLRERVSGISAGAQVGDAVTSVSVDVEASADILHNTTFPAGLTDRTDYVFRVVDGLAELPAGDYLAEYRASAFAGNPIWFNFRLITNGVAATNTIDFANGGTFTGFSYTVFEMATGTRGIQLLDTSTDPDDVLLMDTAGGMIDFTDFPTVNGGSIVPKNGPNTPNTCLLYTSPSPRDS